MWKRNRGGEEAGIVLQGRQMLLFLSAGAFNLFFKLLEYPIYKARLSELIFGLLPLKKSHFPPFRLKGDAEMEICHSLLDVVLFACSVDV